MHDDSIIMTGQTPVDHRNPRSELERGPIHCKPSSPPQPRLRQEAPSQGEDRSKEKMPWEGQTASFLLKDLGMKKRHSNQGAFRMVVLTTSTS